MARMWHFVLALCSFSLVAIAQERPMAWFPLEVGSRWVYEHETKSGDRNRPDVDRWATEETITGWVTIPEGLVLREVKPQGDPNKKGITVQTIGPNDQVRSIQGPDYNRGVLTARDREPYLVRGDCIYVIAGGWDSRTQQLRPEYRKYLSEGALSLISVFLCRWAASGGTTISRGELSRRDATVEARFYPQSILDPFIFLPAILAVVDGKTSGFKRASGSWVNITSTTAPTMSTQSAFCFAVAEIEL
jgi:hypothetical protein